MLSVLLYVFILFIFPALLIGNETRAGDTGLHSSGQAPFNWANAMAWVGFMAFVHAIFLYG